MNKKNQWHRHLGVYGVCINENNEMLVIRKYGGPYTGLYDLPGGSLENPESIQKCLRREVLEECKMEVQTTGCLGCFDFLTATPYDGYDYTHHIALMYTVTVTRTHPDETIEAYVTGNHQKEKNDSLGCEWLPIEAIHMDNASPLVIKARDLITKKDTSYDIVRFPYDSKSDVS